jgi:hypothetical protein
VRYHVFADVDAADGGYVAAEGFRDGAGAAGVVEEADFSGLVLLLLFFWGGPLRSEPGFACLEGIADLLGDFDLVGFGVVS